MTVFIVSYDLHKPVQDYEDLHDAIEAYGDYIHALDSFWLIDADTDDAGDIRSNLEEYIDFNDGLVVLKKSESGVTWSWTGTTEVGDWLDEH